MPTCRTTPIEDFVANDLLLFNEMDMMREQTHKKGKMQQLFPSPEKGVGMSGTPTIHRLPSSNERRDSFRGVTNWIRYRTA